MYRRERFDTREKATRGGVIFTRTRVSLSLPLRKNGVLLVVYIRAYIQPLFLHACGVVCKNYK